MTEHADLLTPAMLRERIAGLPALPPLVGDLLASFQQDNLDAGTLARRIAADQGLLARTLRVANSPFYGLAGQVLSVDDAILVLGFRTVRSLVLSAAMVNVFDQSACKGFAAERFWRHSLAVAVCARALARVTRGNAESAFTAGLLHDIGRYVLALCVPRHYEAVLRHHQAQGCPLLSAERAVLGLDHAQAGAELAAAWGLPATLTSGIRGHHAPAGDAGADLIHLADVLAHALELGGDRVPTVPPIDQGVCARLGVDAAALHPLFPQIERDFEETRNALLS
jgi:putative nucleotidyltransferase with HDIG domain